MSHVGTELLWLHKKEHINYQILLHAHNSFLKWIIWCPKGREGKKKKKKKNKERYKLIINTTSKKDLYNIT